MQKRTRIFAAITVGIGLLLGLAMFLTTLGDVGAVGLGHHGGRHVVVKKNTKTKTIVVVKNGTTVTSTIVSTVTSPTTITVPPSPGTCFALPNPVGLSSQSPLPPVSPPGAVPTLANQAQFELICKGLNPSFAYKFMFSFPCGFVEPFLNSLPLPVIRTGPGEGVIEGVVPDQNGKIAITFIVQNCEVGTGTIHVAQQNGFGVEILPVTDLQVVLTPPGTN